MKKLLFFSVLFCLTVTSILSAQTQRNDYKKIDYLKVSEEDLEDFMDLTQNELKTAYEGMVQAGDLKSWRLYQVKYPGGVKSEYDFVSIATATDLNAFEDNFSEIGTPKFIPSSAGNREKKELGNSSSIVKSELWKVENLIAEDSAAGPSQFMTMDYMNVAPGKNPDYLMLEDEIAKPIHVERMNEDRMAGWEVYSLIAPGGTEYGYNFATGNFFEELEHIEFGFTNRIINQAMGSNVNIPELFNTINKTRDLVKIELWKLAVSTE